MKTVLVTGASAGIGQAISKKYKEENHYVIGIGTREGTFDYLDEYIQCDLSKNIPEISAVDILINNAGINIIRNFSEITFEEFQYTHQINLFAPFMLTQKILPHMLKNKWGRIVNICSIWSKISKTGRASYSSSKFALNGMSIALSNEVCQEGILVNCVSPGFIDTELTRKNNPDLNALSNQVPIKKLGQIEDISELVYFLGSNKNNYITGQNMFIDGGFTNV